MTAFECASRRTALGLMTAVAVVGLLGACGGEAVPPGGGPTSSSSAPTAQPSTAASGAPTGGQLAAPAAEAPESIRALPLETWVTPTYGSVRVGVLISPSGKIGCDFDEDGSSGGCAVWGDNTRDPNEDGITWVELGGKTAKKTVRNDAPYFGNRNEPAQVVAYGTTVATKHFACTSEESGMTCWNRRTGAGAVMNRALGARPITKKTPVSLGAKQSPMSDAATARQPGDPSDATILSGYVPRSVVPDEQTPGRMTNGEYRGFEPGNPGAYVVIAAGESGWREAVRYVDVAGGPEREAVVVLARSRGGVPWANSFVAYDTAGRVVWTWDTRDAGGDPRGGVTFEEVTATSVTLNIPGTGNSAAAANQSGDSTYRLAKGADGKPTFSLVSSRG